MAKRDFMKAFASVYTGDDGRHRVVLPCGNDIPHLMETITMDPVGESLPVMTFKIAVNLVSTKEEALKLYQQTDEKITA